MPRQLIDRPFIKSASFEPSPIPKFGIPAYADSRVNTKVVGTPAWREFWTEQLYYCINGYDTGGVWIPGRYYYYLNFCKTESVKGGKAFYPDYVDYQYEYFLLVEEAKKLGKNIITPKGRRKGMSIVTVAIIDHGWRFLQGYKAGIAAGKKEYSEDFIKKWVFSDALLAPEFKTRKLSDNFTDIISGWQEKDDFGDFTRKGNQNMLYIRTMFSDPEVFKGKFMNDVVFEESGEFDSLVKTWQATDMCVKDGNIQYGTMYIYGTGGNIKSGSKGFEEMWHNPDDYNCLRYFVDGPKYFRPCVAGSTDAKGNLNEDIPNLAHLTVQERRGMEDEERAKEIIIKRKSELMKSTDLTNYWEFCKDNPLDIKDVFRKAASNNFPVKALNDQMYELKSNDKQYAKYRLEWVRDENGLIITPRKVVANPARDTDDANECVFILRAGHPVADYRNLHVAGVDSYDQDQSLTSKSLGAMVVLRRDHNVHGMEKMVPVCLVRCRPKRKEKFYEMCMLVSVYYNLIGNTLMDVRTPMVIQFYKDNGCTQYLARRPLKFESENSEQQHDFGVSLNVSSRPQMVSLLQTYYYDHSGKIWFEDMIEEALNYDELELGSDNDTVDALGIALMQDVANQGIVSKGSEKLLVDRFETPSYIEDSKGNIIPDRFRLSAPPKTEESLENWALNQRMLEMESDSDFDDDDDDDW